MYHSITFNRLDGESKNTWDDWHLVSSVRPFVQVPSIKERKISVPGQDGFLDLSSVVCGYPNFNRREGSWSFLVMNDYQDWIDMYNEMREFVNGHEFNIILEDDPAYMYHGRIFVDDWKSTTPRSTVIIRYSLEPYKWHITSTGEDWLWDPFSFETGIITDGDCRDIEVHTTSDWTEFKFDPEICGTAPISMSISVTPKVSGRSMTFRFVNYVLAIDVTVTIGPGSYVFVPEFVLYGNNSSLFVKGDGKFSIDFRAGRF